MYYFREAVEGNFSEQIFHIVISNMHCSLDIPSSLPSSSSGLFKTNKKTLYCGLIDIQKAVHFKYIQLKLENTYTL